MQTADMTVMKALKGGAIAGFLAIGINNIWSLVANLLGATVPPGFNLAVTIASLLPLLVGSLIYFLLVQYAPKGKMIWLVISIVFMLYSFYPVFNTAQLPDGTVLDSTFPLLTGPMHAFTGFLGIWGIPRFAK